MCWVTRPVTVRPCRLDAPVRHGDCRFNGSDAKRQHSLAPLGLDPLLFGLPLDPMHVAHRGRPPVASRPCMEILESIEVLAPDTAEMGQQGGEVAGPGAEDLGLFQQHGVPGEGFLESPAERDGVALGASPFAEIVVRRQNLPAAVYERSHRLGMTPGAVNLTKAGRS